MILSTVVITGAATAGTLGVVKYRERKRKKEFPWTVAAERLARKSRVAKRHPVGLRIINHLTSSITTVQAKSQALTQGIIAPFVDDTRKGQMEEITASDTLAEVQAEKERIRNVYLSSASLLLVAGGALFYTPLYVPGMLGVAYVYSLSLKGAYQAVFKERRINIDAITVITGGGAFIGGFFVIMGFSCWLTQVAGWVIAKTEYRSRKSLVNLFGERPRFVWVEVDGTEVKVPTEKVQIGDKVVVVAGQMIPVDGTISQGDASIDQRMLTGEAQPIEATVGEAVFASTVVLSGRITVQVEKTGSEMVAAQIGDILNSTADFNLSIKSRVEFFTEKVLPGVFALSGATFFWLGLNQALAVLWFYPGYRMFIVGPMSMLNYLHILSQQGILVKDGRSLEYLKDIDTIVFDKTGTLTVEQPTVSQIFSCSALSASQLLTYAAAAEYRQTHPIAKAILQAAEMRQLEIPQIDHTHYEVGYGIKVNLDDRVIRVGSERFMEMCGITIPRQIKEQQVRCHREGYSLVYVAIDEHLGGAIELVPTVRAEVKDVIRTLRESGKTLYIISGDHEAPTRRLAQELGIDHYFAKTLPENKATIVRQLQEEGRSVCFIGDGINDAIALKQANVSISLRGATTMAMDTAGIVLMDGSLSQLADLFELAQEFNHSIDRSFIMTVVPELMGIASIFLFNWGLSTVVVFRVALWLPLLGNVMLPLYKQRASPPLPLGDKETDSE